MNIDKVSVGKDVPNEVNVILKFLRQVVQLNTNFDKDAGMVVVDRFMPTSMSYPCNYGFIPHTLSGDGDPADVLVYTNYPLQPGCAISVKPIGVLITQDESGADEKILAVPTNKIDPFFAKVNSYKDLPEIVIEKITHFFENYKKLEKGKWVKVEGWQNADAAKSIITEAIKRFSK